MASRLLSRAPTGKGASAAAAAGSAAAALGLGARPYTASCDAPRGAAAPGVRLMQLDGSWEDLLQHAEDASINGPTGYHAQPVGTRGVKSGGGVAATAPIVSGWLDDADAHVAANNSVHSSAKADVTAATTGLGAVSQRVVSIPLTPPTREEAERALDEVESMLTACSGSFLAFSAGSRSEMLAAATMTASEQALLRARSLMNNGDGSVAPGMHAGCSFNSLSSSSSSSSGGAARHMAAVEDLPGDGQLAPDAPRVLPMPMTVPAAATLSSSSIAVGLWGNSNQWLAEGSSFKAQMADMVLKHREKVTGLLEDPGMWTALMANPLTQEILQAEASTEGGLLGTFPSGGGEHAVVPPSGAPQPFSAVQAETGGSISASSVDSVQNAEAKALGAGKNMGNRAQQRPQPVREGVFDLIFSRIHEFFSGFQAMFSHLGGQTQKEHAQQAASEKEQERCAAEGKGNYVGMKQFPGQASTWATIGSILAIVIFAAFVVVLKRR